MRRDWSAKAVGHGAADKWRHQGQPHERQMVDEVIADFIRQDRQHTLRVLRRVRHSLIDAFYGKEQCVWINEMYCHAVEAIKALDKKPKRREK